MDKIRFKFDELCMRQAAGFLISLDKNFVWDNPPDLYINGMIYSKNFSYMKHIHDLLYLADRTKLLDTGSTITGDKFVSLCVNLALQNTYSILMSYSEQQFYKKYGDGELSEYDCDLLTNLYLKYKNISSQEMLENVMCKLPEFQWKFLCFNQTDISYENVLRAEGLSEEEVKEYQELNLSTTFP